MTVFADTLLSGLFALGLEIEASIPSALEAHWRLVADHAKRFNLTAIRDEREAALKHYLDCLLLLPLAREVLEKNRIQGSASVLAADIGSGAGFPGLVLALAWPESSWLLLEATGKKCDFLRLCIEELHIKNARALPLRAEAAGHEPELRGQCALVTARAVAALPVLLEYALPLLAEGGIFFAAKGPALAEEEIASANALAVLGAQVCNKREFTLPDGEKRVIASYRKITPTPNKYPRRAGMPEKRPL
ncbi:MAG: 16S rRNA (guanine(527)-N(7))-methyltransferase RsmG [Clostridiales bacterium]|nr:16S rRNA (guanine(527)-N(7))-methyltransferase RsmG [Clostridiales bacterium]